MFIEKFHSSLILRWFIDPISTEKSNRQPRLTKLAKVQVVLSRKSQYMLKRSEILVPILFFHRDKINLMLLYVIYQRKMQIIHKRSVHKASLSS